QFSLPLGVVDDVGPADELNGRIVAGGNPLLRRGSCRGTPRAGHKGIITDDSDDNVGVAFKRRPDRVSASKVDQQSVPDANEMGRDNERRLARQSINTELAEVMAFSEPGLPLGVVQGGIPGVDEHVKPPQKAGRAHPVGERYRSRTSHATPFRTVAFNDNAAGHGWTLPVPTPRP